MKFVADEGVDKEIVRLLRQNDYDVLYIAELLPGSADSLILKSARKENRIIITRDKDFGELVFRDKMIHSGIILNRLYELTSEEKAKIVLKVVEEFGEKLLGAFTVIQPNKIRIRRF